MFYLMTHSAHFIHSYMASNIWQNLQLPQLHRLICLINSKGYFICTIPDRVAHTTVFNTHIVKHGLEQEITQWVHHEGSIR